MISLYDAVAAFQRVNPLECEYGVNDEDAARGMRAAFAAAGVAYRDDFDVRTRWAERAARRRRAAYARTHPPDPNAKPIDAGTIFRAQTRLLWRVYGNDVERAPTAIFGTVFERETLGLHHAENRECQPGNRETPPL